MCLEKYFLPGIHEAVFLESSNRLHNLSSGLLKIFVDQFTLRFYKEHLAPFISILLTVNFQLKTARDKVIEIVKISVQLFMRILDWTPSTVGVFLVGFQRLDRFLHI